MNDKALARRAIGLIDLTELGDGAGAASVRALCATALGGNGIPPVAAVCVWPRHAALAVGLLRGTGIRVATVINFPSGDAPLDAVIGEAREALSHGVDEIDLVMPWKAFLNGDAGPAEAMIRAVKAQLFGGRRLKVIVETGMFPDAGTVRGAADMAIAAGADFIKTSTGKVAVGATPDAARAMLEAIRDSGRPVGLKPSGGIRTLADARAYLDLADTIMGPDWASADTFRFGASGLHGALLGVITGAAATVGKGY